MDHAVRDKSLGQVAYEAYRQHIIGRQTQGVTIVTYPTWEEAGELNQSAWEESAIAVSNSIFLEMEDMAEV